MKKALASVRRFAREEDGAAMVEYTILLGIITALVIALVVAVGGYVSGTWTDLCTTLNGAGGAGCVPAP